MSNFDNGDMGDGGLQKSREKLRTHADGTPMRNYTQLTYEELQKKIEDAFASEEFGDPLSKEAEESYKAFELAYPLTDAPEGWEAKRRAQLNKTVRSGAYSISMPGMSVWTGKGGYIDYLIALEKSAKRYK